MNDFSARIWSRFAVAFWNVAMLTSSHASRQSAAQTHDGDSSGSRNPVLLIHGIYDSAASMQVMRSWLAAQGWNVFALSLSPSDGSVGLDEIARQISDYVETTFRRGEKIDLVGFSMGGLAARYYVQRLGGVRRVARFVSISAPNHGSWLAWLSTKPGCVQMRPQSAWLQDLNSDPAALKQVQFTSLWSPLDLVILPARSARMPLGREVRTWVIAHPLMVLYHGSLRAVTEILLEPMRNAPSARLPNAAAHPGFGGNHDGSHAAEERATPFRQK